MAKTEPKITLEEPMIKLTFGYGTIYMIPWDEGIQIMNLMKHAVPIISKYDTTTSKQVYSRSNISGCAVEALPPENTAQVLMGESHE